MGPWRTRLIALLCLLLMGLNGCLDLTPSRRVEFEKPSQVVYAYRDYLWLEKAGVKNVNLEMNGSRQNVSLAYYLYFLAQAFEVFGWEKDAQKLYLHLFLNFPGLNRGGPLGLAAENRLHWILGDKSWVVHSMDDLILRLESALQKRDPQALGRLISHDFGFGRSRENRLAMHYQDGVQAVAADFPRLRQLAVEIISKNQAEAVLKTTGWEQGKKIWYLVLHYNTLAKGWEWDLSYWEDEAH